jgi:hypothetical protein
MPELTSEGSFNVRITTYKVKPTPKEDDPRGFQILLYGETSDGYTAIGTLNWIKTVIGSGKHAGKECREVARETLAEIGVPDGYPPNLDAAIENGLRAQFVTKFDTYNSQTKLKVAFINPVTELLTPDEVDWSQLLDDAPAKEPKKAVAAPAAKRAMPDKNSKADDIPF